MTKEFYQTYFSRNTPLPLFIGHSILSILAMVITFTLTFTKTISLTVAIGSVVSSFFLIFLLVIMNAWGVNYFEKLIMSVLITLVIGVLTFLATPLTIKLGWYFHTPFYIVMWTIFAFLLVDLLYSSRPKTLIAHVNFPSGINISKQNKFDKELANALADFSSHYFQLDKSLELARILSDINQATETTKHTPYDFLITIVKDKDITTNLSKLSYSLENKDLLEKDRDELTNELLSRIDVKITTIIKDIKKDQKQENRLREKPAKDKSQKIKEDILNL